MTDYKEEQANELEALESIYPEELTLVSMQPYPSFTIFLEADFNEYDEHEICSCILQFTYTEKYPDEAPVVEIQPESIENMDDQQVQSLVDLMKDQAEENLGMAMVFTIVAAAQEHLLTLMEQVFKDKKEAVERKIREEEEKERKRFEGTRVTIESFLAWKAKFDAELHEIKRQQGRINNNTQKLTGLQLFKEHHALDDSDVAFLEEDVEAVAVDESLFDELDDLELEDEDES